MVLYQPNEILGKFESFAACHVQSGDPPELYEPIQYIMSLGGKRLRPVLLLMAANLFHDDIEAALRPALGLEMFHNFTLIHDDIMDEAPLRRGHLSVHKKFGLNTALLSGDIMFVKAGVFMMSDYQKNNAELVSIFNEMAIAVCEGQQLDMNFEEQDAVTIKDYLRMIDLKTAALFDCCMRIGALSVGAEKEEVARMGQFGRALGISFQLMDDWLDLFGELEKTGKKVGGDIVRNKKTYLLLKSLEKADLQTKTELEHWLAQNGESQKKVEAVKSIYKKLNVGKEAEKEMLRNHDLALTHLDLINIPAERKLLLKKFSFELLSRQL